MSAGRYMGRSLVLPLHSYPDVAHLPPFRSHCFLTNQTHPIFPVQVSWFAVGCYYLMVGHKNEHARRYLRQAAGVIQSP